MGPILPTGELSHWTQPRFRLGDLTLDSALLESTNRAPAHDDVDEVHLLLPSCRRAGRPV